MKIQNILLSVIALALIVIAFFLNGIYKNNSDAKGNLVKNADNTSSEAPEVGTQLCMAFDMDSIGNCQKGTKLMFLPQRWGNDQLPIIVAGSHCDFNHPVVYNNGGVACVKLSDAVVHEPEQKEEAKQDEK